MARVRPLCICPHISSPRGPQRPARAGLSEPPDLQARRAGLAPTWEMGSGAQGAHVLIKDEKSRVGCRSIGNMAVPLTSGSTGGWGGWGERAMFLEGKSIL